MIYFPNLAKNFIYRSLLFCICVLLFNCNSPKKKKEVVLYETYCASCHISPEINSLPKDIWAEKILPEMGARLGIRDSGYNPYKGLSFTEMDAVIKTGVFPGKPLLDKNDWELLKAYIIGNAPDSLKENVDMTVAEELSQFTPTRISLDSTKGSLFTYLEFIKDTKGLLLGDLYGNLSQYSFVTNENRRLGRFGSPIVSIGKDEDNMIVAAIGSIRPSELFSGRLFEVNPDTIKIIPEALHRPVDVITHDFDKDGIKELVVSEFGDVKGKLSLFKRNTEKGPYQKQILLNQPGTIKAEIRDMDKDGREDLVVLTAQGDEGVTILYNQNDLKFRAEKAIRFSPVYGTSAFQIVDYDHDGDEDIITVHGDNADKSFVPKPYHGMRIHLNDGKGVFTEAYFYPLNGATALEALDFDKDGDIDIALVSSFPDYQNNPDLSFVFLENKNELNFEFSVNTFNDSNSGRWFLLDTGDIDGDGDEDIILSSFTYIFTPVPESFSQQWNEENVDLMVLKNNLK